MKHTSAASLDILDLGCGTGKCGVALAAARKRHLVGIDLSEKMLEQARAREVYDQLHLAEIHQWLRTSLAAQFDLVIAADVLIYIGAITELFHEVERVLRPGGWFAFSTEECEDEEFQLLPTGRYAQSQDYVRRSADAFSLVAAESTTVRIESGTPIAGRLYLLRRQ